MNIFSNLKQEFDKETIKKIAGEMGVKNADITIKEKISLDNLIDSFSKNRVYIPALFAINKADTLDKNKNYRLESPYDIKPIFLSADKDENVDLLLENIWKTLSFITVYLVKKDEAPTNNSPIIVKSGTSLKQISEMIGEKFSENTTCAVIWGNGSKFPAQEVSLEALAKDGMQVKFI